jgi:microcystin-dependent protein
VTEAQLPGHAHAWLGSANSSTGPSPTGMLLGDSVLPLYATEPFGNPPALGAMAATMIGGAGGSQPHQNMQPFLCISFIISIFGVIPRPQ